MKFKWPWESDDKEEEEEESVQRNPIIEEEKNALKRETGQIKNINRHVLARALSRNWLDSDQAEALEAIQMDKGTVGGTDSPTD